MKYSFLLLIFTVLGVAACQTAGQTAEFKKFATDADVPRIAVEDAKKDFDAKNVVFVDSRIADAFKGEHIVGAINIPIGSPASEFDKIPKGKKIIVYCS